VARMLISDNLNPERDLSFISKLTSEKLALISNIPYQSWTLVETLE